MSDKGSNGGIKLNRNRRRWNKYGKYLLTAGIAAAVAAGIIFFGIDYAKKNAPGGSSSETTQETDVASQSSGNAETSAAAETVTETTSAGSTAKSYTLTGTPSDEKFTSKSVYKKVILVGDTFVNALSTDGYISSDNVYTASYFPSSSALKYIDKIVAEAPEKVIVMFGYDDARDDRTATESASDIIKIASGLKSKLTSSEIICVSELPITKEYETDTAEFKQSKLDEINQSVKKQCEAAGIKYIDIATAFTKSGYMNPNYTEDGYHILSSYNYFVLNGIASFF